MNKYLVMVSLVGIAVVFQNCSDQSFSSRADLNKPLSVESEQLVEEDIPETIKDDVENVLNDDKDDGQDNDKDDYSADNGGKDVVKDEPKKYGSDGDDDKDTTKEEPKKYVSGGDDDDDKDSTDDKDASKDYGKDQGRNVATDEIKKRVSCKDRKDGNARFVCILAGPGKSTHVAVINDQIVESNSTPKTACMSANACEEIVGKKLTVKSVEKRGYCKNGTPQVLMFTDAEIQRLMDKAQ
jgi:hypothetical protein